MTGHHDREMGKMHGLDLHLPSGEYRGQVPLRKNSVSMRVFLDGRPVKKSSPAVDKILDDLEGWNERMENFLIASARKGELENWLDKQEVSSLHELITLREIGITAELFDDPEFGIKFYYFASVESVSDGNYIVVSATSAEGPYRVDIEGGD